MTMTDEGTVTVTDPDEFGSKRAFGINVACWGTRWHLYVNGRLDSSSATSVVEIAEVLASRGAPAVDLDLAGVTFIDQAARRAIAYASEILAASGAVCRLLPPGPTCEVLTGR